MDFYYDSRLTVQALLHFPKLHWLGQEVVSSPRACQCAYILLFFRTYQSIRRRRIITTPTELIKIRQQALLTRTSALRVTRQIIQEHGLRGLYRGIAVTALRDCGYGAYFFAVCKTPIKHIDIDKLIACFF